MATTTTTTSIHAASSSLLELPYRPSIAASKLLDDALASLVLSHPTTSVSVTAHAAGTSAATAAARAASTATVSPLLLSTFSSSSSLSHVLRAWLFLCTSWLLTRGATLVAVVLRGLCIETPRMVAHAVAGGGMAVWPWIVAAVRALVVRPVLVVVQACLTVILWALAPVITFGRLGGLLVGMPVRLAVGVLRELRPLIALAPYAITIGAVSAALILTVAYMLNLALGVYYGSSDSRDRAHKPANQTLLRYDLIVNSSREGNKPVGATRLQQLNRPLSEPLPNTTLSSSPHWLVAKQRDEIANSHYDRSLDKNGAWHKHNEQHQWPDVDLNRGRGRLRFGREEGWRKT